MLSKGYYFGIKNESQDLSSYFENILDSNPKFLIAGSFSFWLPVQLWKKLAKLNCPKLILLPFKYDSNNITFELKKLRFLIKSNTAIIINSLNHSKFILTDNHCFVGSNNLSSGGIINNIENCAIMKNTDIDYDDWYDEIIGLIRKEYRNFSSITNTISKEAKLSNLPIPVIKSEMSQSELITSINQLKELYTSLIELTDCYQHLEHSFKELVNNTKKTIKLFDSPITSLTKYLIDNLTNQFNEKNSHKVIWIKNYTGIKFKVDDLSNSLSELNSRRKLMLDLYNDTWRENQLIYDKIDDSCSNLNIKNLYNFKKYL